MKSNPNAENVWSSDFYNTSYTHLMYLIHTVHPKLFCYRVCKHYMKNYKTYSKTWRKTKRILVFFQPNHIHTKLCTALWLYADYGRKNPMRMVYHSHEILKIIFHHQNGLFPQEKSGRDVRLTTHLRIVPRLRMGGTTHPLPPTCLHGVLRDHIIYQFLCDLGGREKKTCHEQGAWSPVLLL